MPRIPTTPSPTKFAQTWSQDFKEAVKKAAGKDGRLSVSEAKKLATGTDAEKLFADNASNYFTTTGKKTVSVDVIAREMQAYAQRAAEIAAGPDKKVSLADGQKLPNDLKEDFFFLRGKATPATTPTTPGTSDVARLRTELAALTDGLWMTSETDAKLLFVSGPNLNGAPITADVVRQHLSAQHDALIGDVMWVAPGEEALANRTPVEERDAAEFLAARETVWDPDDAVMVANAERFSRLNDKLTSELTDLKVFRFGEVNISTFIVGRSRSGELVGLLTGQVET